MYIPNCLLLMPPGALYFPEGGGGGKGEKGDCYGTKSKSVFPNTPQYFVQMILNNLQKKPNKQTKKNIPKIQRQ